MCRLHFFAAFFLLFSAVLFSGATQALTITLRADEWSPFNGDPKSDHPGYLIELATRIFANAGHKVDYQQMPWQRAIADVRAGKFDCIVGAYKDDAPDFVFPSVPLGRDQQGFFRADGKSWHFDAATVSQQRLAVIGAYSYDDGGVLDTYIKSNARSPNLHISTGDAPLARNIRMLVAGRVDVVVSSKTVMEAKLDELKLTDQVQRVDTLGEPQDVYIACAPGKILSKTYTELLSKGVQTLRASGELQTILRKYGLGDWQ
jgi:polar amino acid transport system substrate-binding protein